MNKIKNLLPFLVTVFLLVIPIIIPYLHSGYFPTHDGEWAVVRLADMYRSAKDLQIPVRYSGYLNSGYGYPLFNFAYPFPYYLALIPLFMGFGFVGSIKILFALSVPLSVFFMFLLSRKLWKNDLAGLISAVFYTYLPYRFVDLFVRGSIGESLSFVIFPLLFYLSLKIKEKPQNISLTVISAIFYAVLVSTHNIMTVIFTPIFLIFNYLLYQNSKQKKDFLKSLIIIFTLAVLLSAFFWFPALFEKGLIRLSEIPIADRNLYFVSLKQFIFPSWGFEPPTEKGGFSYQIGLPQLLVFITVLVLTIVKSIKKTPSKNFAYVLPMSVIILDAIFFLFQPSAFLWKNIPLLSEINYPWTMLSQIGFLVSLLAGFTVTQSRIFKYISIFLAISAIILFLPYAKPKEYVNRGDGFYVSNDATTTSSDELLPLWVKQKPPQRFDKKIIVENREEVENLMFNSKETSFQLNSDQNNKVTINTIYYPGWKVYIDGKETPITYDNNFGVMQFLVPQGKHNIKSVFTETTARFTSDIISITAIIFSSIILISKKVRLTLEKYLYS